jgi:DNA-binding CsgD family transcriptional regulator
VADGRCWGCFGLYRDRGRPEFIEDEAAFVAEVDAAIAGGIRRALLRAAAPPQRWATRGRPGPARTVDGRWVVLHATLLADGAEPRTAVIIEPARPAELAELIVLAYVLTPRERAVTRLVIQGHSTNEIAEAMRLSPFTVQDHLKAVFDKVGVRSRRELVATVFHGHYWPRVLQDAPISHDGWYASGADHARCRRRDAPPSPTGHFAFRC